METNTHRYTKKNLPEKMFPPNPNDPQLTLQDLEEMNKQLLAQTRSAQFQFLAAA